MKAQILFKKIAFVLLVSASALMLQSFTRNNHFNDGKPGPISSQVSYLGADEQYFLFEVTVTNEDSSLKNSLRINIKANNQDDIFDELYQAGKMRKIFKISKTDIEKISFCILSRHKTTYFHFDVERFYSERVNVVPSKVS